MRTEYSGDDDCLPCENGERECCDKSRRNLLAFIALLAEDQSSSTGGYSVPSGMHSPNGTKEETDK